MRYHHMYARGLHKQFKEYNVRISEPNAHQITEELGKLEIKSARGSHPARKRRMLGKVSIFSPKHEYQKALRTRMM